MSTDNDETGSPSSTSPTAKHPPPPHCSPQIRYPIEDSTLKIALPSGKFVRTAGNGNPVTRSYGLSSVAGSVTPMPRIISAGRDMKTVAQGYRTYVLSVKPCP